MKIKNFEKGQAIVIIALSMIGLIAMAALIIDGSNSYLNRRRAQTAADAAAIAGAREYCIAKGSETDVGNVVAEYATIQNHATAIEHFDINNGIIEVEVSLTANTFFAKVFAEPESTVNAYAAAGCYNPGTGKGMLPVAWMCKDIDQTDIYQLPECDFKAITYSQLVELHNPNYDLVEINDYVYETPYAFEGNYVEAGFLRETYIIMDTTALADTEEHLCQPEGTLECDYDGDGLPDFLGKGDSHWLDLDGTDNNCPSGGGAAALKYWMNNGFPCNIGIHTWIPSQEGEIQAAMIELGNVIDGASIEDHLFLVPIFNQHCVGDPFVQDCQDAAHTTIPLPPSMSQDNEVPGNYQADTFYHVVGFGFFYVSCVSKQSTCPGNQYAQDNYDFLDQNDTTIEGFFVTGVPVDFGASGSGGVDMGVYVLSLTD